MPICFILFAILLSACDGSPVAVKTGVTPAVTEMPVSRNDAVIRTVHVFVALCDNQYQGIVPVPAFLGNGQDPASNLYWGAAAGVKTWFRKKQSEWQLVHEVPGDDDVLERLLFLHKHQKVYLLAEAYDGRKIRPATIAFLQASGGQLKVPVIYREDTLYFGGRSSLVAYVGHDGLMDFTLDESFHAADSNKRDAVILACYSKSYFKAYLQATGAYPLVWTTGLMAPEAYTLHDALSEWVKGSDRESIRDAAAAAYARYQKCSVKAARNLLVSGW